MSREDVIQSTENSLNRLKVDKIDLMYVHYPAGDYDPEETLEAFNQLVEKGLAEKEEKIKTEEDPESSG